MPFQGEKQHFIRVIHLNFNIYFRCYNKVIVIEKVILNTKKGAKQC
jgi:hypothetical protein